jgi:hypothetical protein
MPQKDDMPGDSWSQSTPDFGWVETGFAIGSRPYAQQRKTIAELGIRVVVALHEPTLGDAEVWQAYGVQFIQAPTQDWVAIPAASFDRVVEIVSSCLQSATPVLLHCYAGLNRAPTYAAAVLCHARRMDVDTALAIVGRARPAARPTPEQEKSLREWYRMRCGVSSAGLD